MALDGNRPTTTSVPDTSGQGNDAVVTGTLELETFNRCTQGICCDDTNFATLTGAAGSELQGWFKEDFPGLPWRFFDDAAQIPQIEKVGEDYQLKNGCYAHLMMSSGPVELVPLATESGDTLTTEGGDTITT